MTVSITTLSIMTLSKTTLSIMTLSIMTVSITTLSIMTISKTTLSIWSLSITKLGMTTLSVMTHTHSINDIMILHQNFSSCHVMLSVLTLNVIIPSVVAPMTGLDYLRHVHPSDYAAKNVY
jgi:hypothetical protein